MKIIERTQDLKAGDKIHCLTWETLKHIALKLSSDGFGVAVIGFGDMSDNILTITALPERPKDEQLEGQMSIEDYDI